MRVIVSKEEQLWGRMCERDSEDSVSCLQAHNKDTLALVDAVLAAVAEAERVAQEVEAGEKEAAWDDEELGLPLRTAGVAGVAGNTGNKREVLGLTGMVLTQLRWQRDASAVLMARVEEAASDAWRLAPRRPGSGQGEEVREEADCRGDVGGGGGDVHVPSEAEMEMAAARKAALKRVMADRDVDASNDCELDALFRIIRQKFELISSANIIHHWVATFLQRLTRKLILSVLETTEYAKNVICVLVGGIQIETTEDIPNMFSLLTFETRTMKGQMHSHLDQVHYHLKRQVEKSGEGGSGGGGGGGGGGSDQRK